MRKPHERFVVITGGPGSGKTTLLHRLAERGFAIMPDAGTAVPWEDTERFAEALLTWEMRAYRVAERERADLVFFDRGVPDIAAYLRLLGHPVGPHVEAAIALYRYRPRVFIAPPWQAIFSQECGRYQDFADACRTHEAMAAAYVEYGYELVELPEASVDERVEFVLANR